MKKKKVIIAVGGSSGAVYAKLLLDKLVLLSDQWANVGVVFSKNGYVNWQLELGATFDPSDYPFDFYENNDFYAPFASGSAHYGVMIVCPCSMGILGRIASGISTDLTTRAADVVLKERRLLICVPRETPYSTIHLQNMLLLSQSGAIISPACPSFYSNPETIEEAMATVVDRVLDLAGFELTDTYRWGE